MLQTLMCSIYSSIQHEAARLDTGLTKSVLLENLYKECGYTTLSQRRQQHKLSFMYNVYYWHGAFIYYQDLIPPLFSELSDYP